MTEIERMLSQYELVLHGNAWHGDAIWKILDNTSAVCAAHRHLQSVIPFGKS